MFSVKKDDADSHNSSSTVAGEEEFSLAHLSDPHLSSLHDVSFGALLNKRILGYLSWRLKRRHVHRPEILSRLVADLKHHQVDHTVITGDLTHLGLPFEYREALDWLKTLGGSDEVTVIPGNHDAYWPTPEEGALGLWRPFLVSDPPYAAEALFPSVRIRGKLALIGLSTAHPSAPFLAVGSLGAQQKERLAKVLERTGAQGLLRVVLLHHPPVQASISWRKRLTDHGDFARVLARHGAGLVLHGHAHRPFRGELPGPAGPIPVVGVPSASETVNGSNRGAKYHVCRFLREGDRWQINVSVRTYIPESDIFVQESEFKLYPPTS